METFHQHFFLLKKIIWDNQNVIWGYQNVGKGKDLLKSHICCGPSARLNIPKTHKNSKLWVVFGVFAVKYTYFKPQNILIEAKNILMISYTYEAKICRTTPENLEIGKLVVKIFPLFLFPGKPIIILEILHFQCRHDLKLGARRPALKPGPLRMRLRFCWKYENWSEDDWMR